MGFKVSVGKYESIAQESNTGLYERGGARGRAPEMIWLVWISAATGQKALWLDDDASLGPGGSGGRQG